MSRAKNMLLVAVAALVLAGAALADPLDPKVRLNPIDERHAQRAMLQQSDLGAAWVGGQINPPSSLKAPVCPSLRPNFSNLTITGHAESAYDNGNGGVQVASDVEVWQTAKQAARHYALMLKPAINTCIRYSLLKSAGTDQNATFLPVKRTDFPKLAPVTRHYRASIAYKLGSQTVTVYSDFIFLGKGRTQIYLNVTAPAVSANQLRGLEVRIARALLKRVRV